MGKQNEKNPTNYHYPLPAPEKETGRESRKERMLPSGGNQVRPDTAG